MPIMGITRISDVTGLDTLGIPVVMVCRPNARSLAVSQGKGLTLAAAKASGLMESVEAYHAERIQLPLKLSTFNALRFTHPMADITSLPRVSLGAFHGDLRLLWVEGRDVARNAPVWLPYDLVHTDYSLPLAPGSGAFLASSSGLASGNHPLEALSHGLCELVERDAGTLWHMKSEDHRRRTRVDLATVDDPACQDILGCYERADVAVFVWETTSDIGIPAYLCIIVDRDPNPHRAIAPMGGMGCHPSRAIALLRALTEAAQSRLTLITGARDDVRFGMGHPSEDLEAARQWLDRHGAAPAMRGFDEAPDFEGESFDEDVAWELERLRQAGLEQAVVVDLTRPEFAIPVVRVVVPGLEPLYDTPGYVPGARANRCLRGTAP